MKRFLLCLLLGVAVPLLFPSCKSNPETGRSQLLLLSQDEEIQMGIEAYAQVGKEARFIADRAYVDPVLRVGRAIADAAHHPEFQWNVDVEKFQWEFKVIDDAKTVNAWCLPGGKIAFYTGIYPVLQDENSMAIVMGHEVAHALLQHGNERVSQNIVVSSVATTVDLLAQGSQHHDLAMAALGLGASVGILLPYSRKHETEADKIGLKLAAVAGYDPQAAVGLWERMNQMGGGRPPEFLSTHPNPEHRIENMKKWMPGALQRYEASLKKPNSRLPSPAR